MAAQAQEQTQGYGWTDGITPDEGGFVLLPDGEASFEVLSMQRARRSVGDCGTVNVCDMTLLVTSDANNQTSKLEASLPLHPKFTWKITQFFTSIGARKHGDTGRFVPDWGKITGTSGRCRITTRTYQKKAGGEGKANQVDAFLDPVAVVDCF
jgi:hypothetical protein